ncbi:MULTISPECIES: DMT family transporter [Bacillus]|nr:MULTISPECIES: DMT family transporter [Bacillus]MBP1081758.1 drug/metabolite transporter (DMT)-like permease [Bacillus capparidis]MED1096409.1 DMT family transporter [Bacillus capparidis]
MLDEILSIRFAMVIVGSSIVAGELSIQKLPIFLISELRFLIASAILVPIWLLYEGRPSLKIKDALLLLLQALCGVFLFNIFMLTGLKSTSAIDAGIISSTAPAAVCLLAFFLFGERLTLHRFAAILLAVTGASVLQLTGFSAGNETDGHLLGNVFILAAVICEALFVSLGKLVSARVSPLGISTVVSIYGAIMFFRFSLQEFKKVSLPVITFETYGIILYYGIIVTVVAFLLLYQGLTKISAGTAGVLSAITPVSTAILSILILGEKLTFLHVIGISLVFAAIFFASIPVKKVVSEVK